MLTSPTLAYRWRWAALAALLAAEAMNLLDATIVQVAGPAIHADLAGPASDIQWFAAAYTLPFAVLLITGGRLGDIAGRARVFRVGVAGFVIASLACALSGSAGMLIAARAVQGAAAALIIPQTLGLIRAMFDGAELPRALGSIGPVMGLSAVCGPVLGGFLTHADLLGSSWRSVFVVNVPLGLAVLALAPLLREDRAAHRQRLDLSGTALVTFGTGLLVYPLIEGDAAGWPAWTWIALAGGVVVLVVFWLQQHGRSRRGRAALVEPSLFGNRGFPAALVSSTLFFAVMNGVMLTVVLQAQLTRHVDVLTSGLTLLPWSCGMAVSSWVSGAYLFPRFGAKLMFGGLTALLAGTLLLIAAYATESGYSWPAVPALALGGLGLGMFTTPFFSTALERVRPHETGSAAGLLNAVQQLGGTLGIALLGTLFLRTGAAPAALWAAVALLIINGLATAVMIGATVSRR
ncbi:MFS transporter [Planotetraspora mira]|uniref:MFS transporter n=1 Tax=Planotetraspora mira TaxID=58121 RepID=A0A8J3XAE4_9ACTN|nr:MFS transporter [Planotetraspora mira]GII33381.1 MFS transporter [Planotetraspora mira]